MITLEYEMQILQKEDKLFPEKLRVLNDCPDIIYILGNKYILNDFSLAVVGSRICDDYGKTITAKLVKELVKRNVCIVSGLANGIDTVAHATAIENGGKTIAIIGSGFKSIYPLSNKVLVDNIIKNGGTIISEYLPDQAPLKQCFPHRNRLVSAMTDGTIVTQARNNSGALITADYAKKLNKKLFAVPGEITNSKSMGSNILIRNGAKIVLDIDDIMNEYQTYKYHYKEANKTTNIVVDEKQKDTYELIDENVIHINEICKMSKKSPQQIMCDLTLLEMDNLISSLPGGFYRRIIR